MLACGSGRVTVGTARVHGSMFAELEGGLAGGRSWFAGPVTGTVSIGECKHYHAGKLG
jgi:hypothetical protein